MVQRGIIMPGKKNFDPNFRVGENVYIITESHVPDMSRENVRLGKPLQASLTLLRPWPADDADECIRVDWRIADKGEITGMAGVLKRILSIAPVANSDSTAWLTPEEVMSSDLYPDADDLDGLCVIADLQNAKPFQTRDGVYHHPVQCFKFRAPTVAEGGNYLQRTQYLADGLNGEGYPTSYTLYSPPTKTEMANAEDLGA